MDSGCGEVSATAAVVDTSKAVYELRCVLASMLLDALKGECCDAIDVEDLSRAFVGLSTGTGPL
jgi:hypothetical protein